MKWFWEIWKENKEEHLRRWRKSVKEIETNYPEGSKIKYLGVTMVILYHDYIGEFLNPCWALEVEWMDKLDRIQHATITPRDFHLIEKVEEV